ncbi:hypothetical protein KP509_18G016600 [Ceratopteris richardii]|uniref:Uncharacterized protein n=1 Tax=Ceratopteris richardii TaxID=49495 RepID=A0A8T2SMT0_CERRI|nr:hypothetical protein KP509_18G016600 [Ceratopteris richardii]
MIVRRTFIGYVECPNIRTYSHGHERYITPTCSSTATMSYFGTDTYQDFPLLFFLPCGGDGGGGDDANDFKTSQSRSSKLRKTALQQIYDASVPDNKATISNSSETLQQTSLALHKLSWQTFLMHLCFFASIEFLFIVFLIITSFTLPLYR